MTEVLGVPGMPKPSQGAATAIYEAHLREIGEAHGIEIIWLASILGRAHRIRRYVRIPHPTTRLRYLIGLHEFGHCIAPHGYWGRFIEREGVAWEWAVHHARCVVGRREAQAIVRRLDHYLEYGPRHHRAQTPASDSSFWRTYHHFAASAAGESRS